jgi:hypothetical protein
VQLFLPFQFVIVSYFAILRKLLVLISFILLLWSEPQDLTLESCFFPTGFGYSCMFITCNAEKMLVLIFFIFVVLNLFY